MTIRREDFSMYLTSRVNKAGNTPSCFETKLPAPIELEGSDWEVGVSSLHYGHTWHDAHREFEIGILFIDPDLPDPDLNRDRAESAARRQRRDAPTQTISLRNFQSRRQNLEVDEVLGSDSNRRVTGVGVRDSEKEKIKHDLDVPPKTLFERSVYELRESLDLTNAYIRFAKVPRGNYPDPKMLCKLIQDAINNSHDPKFNLTLAYDEITRRASLSTPIRHLYLVTEYHHSFLNYLGVYTYDNLLELGLPTKLEYLFLSPAKSPLQSRSDVSLKKFTGIYVYTDIIEHSIVGDAFAPCLTYVPIDSKYGELGHYWQNPPIYHRVNRTLVSSIELSLRTHEGELLPMVDGEVMVQLHFRRRFKL